MLTPLLVKSTEAHGAREAALEALKARKAADGSVEIDWDDEKEQLCAATTFEVVEEGDLTPRTMAPARLGDIYELKPAPPHLRLPRLTQGLPDVDCWDPPALFVLTDELYHAPIAVESRPRRARSAG